MNVLLLANIANAFATLASNPAFGKDAAKLSPIASLVALAFQTYGMADSDRSVLLSQISEANIEGRGLTESQIADWKSRHEAAKAVIDQWAPR